MVQVLDPAVSDAGFPRSVTGLAILVDHAREHGLPVSGALAGTDLGPRDLEDPERAVTADQELRVVRNLRAAGLADGAAVGRRYRASSFGIAGYALLSSRTLLDAMTFALRFLDLTFIFALPQARIGADEVVVELDDSALPADVRGFLLQRDMVAMDAVMRELLAGDLRTTVDLEARTIRFAAADLARVLPHANPATLTLCEQLCADLASERRDGSPLAQQVRVLLAQRLAFDASVAGVAAGLAMSERTLRRRLAEDGTGFQVLLDEVRTSLAEKLLATGSLTVAEVAHRLGYAEAASFIHAYKRWHGRTPKAPASL
ncbi:AraC family transcriptional regulator ligand-binding domain-containing protein [Marmoricola sp. RAF53]|uniref:AraC family transcriptional regulator n=1 Tax=Marmoricola sp. RAF53 TaxID=3233059 RepID=UPI003F9939E5